MKNKRNWHITQMEESVPDKKQFQYSVTSGLSAQVGGVP